MSVTVIIGPRVTTDDLSLTLLPFLKFRSLSNNGFFTDVLFLGTPLYPLIVFSLLYWLNRSKQDGGPETSTTKKEDFVKGRRGRFQTVREFRVEKVLQKGLTGRDESRKFFTNWDGE